MFVAARMSKRRLRCNLRSGFGHDSETAGRSEKAGLTQRRFLRSAAHMGMRSHDLSSICALHRAVRRRCKGGQDSIGETARRVLRTIESLTRLQLAMDQHAVQLSVSRSGGVTDLSPEVSRDPARGVSKKTSILPCGTSSGKST